MTKGFFLIIKLEEVFYAMEFIRPPAETWPLRAGYFQKQCWAEDEARPQLNLRP